MPMNLSVGLSRKIGESNFGSRGASCHVEVELDAAIVSDDPAQFQQHVREAFAACRHAVEEELARTPARNSSDQPTTSRSPRSASGDRAPSSERGAPRPATENQVKALRAIAHRAGIQLEAELSERYGVRSPQALSLAHASQLIDSLKRRLDAQPIAG